MSKVKLNQIIAVSNGLKSKTKSCVEKLYHICQKSELFDGLDRQYHPKYDEGETLPSENKKIQNSTTEIIEEFKHNWSEMFDAVITQDLGNTQAFSDIEIDGEKILEKVPVTTLIFLEKQLTDIKTFISKMPTLSSSDNWKFDNGAGVFKSDPIETNRLKKISKPIVLYDATPEHPAQTQLVTEDIITGIWRTIKTSSAIPLTYKTEMLERVHKLKLAVVKARESANSAEVDQIKRGNAVLNYIFK